MSTIIPCPQGCGGTVATDATRCPSCRRELFAREVFDYQPCGEWFGPPDHRMLCRKSVGHIGRGEDAHSTHRDCGQNLPSGGICGEMELHCTLAASQARVAELEAWPCEGHDCEHDLKHVDANHYDKGDGSGTWHCGHCWDKAMRKSAAKDAALNAMRERTQRELVNLSADHSWCRLCRTERTGQRGSYAEHPHAPDCVLSLEAVKLAADAQARRDEAVAEAVAKDVCEQYFEYVPHTQPKIDELNRVVRAALAKVKP